MIDEELRLGIEAAKNNDLEKARSYLAKAVENDPNSEEGWLWLGDCSSDTEQRKLCYERVLKLNPKNEKAQQELDNILLAQVVDAPNNVLDDSIKIEEKMEKTSWKSNPTILRLMGLITGCMVCGLSVIFLSYSGVLGSITGEISPNIPKEVIETAPENDSLNLDNQDPPIFSDADIPQVRELINNEKYADAILILDEIIKSSPELDTAYFLRAYCYHALLDQQRSQIEFQDYLNRALNDINQAIAIRPDDGNYYALRDSILTNLAALQEYRVDVQYISQFALENAVMAINLGTQLDEYPDRTYVIDLIFVDRCEEALQEISKMISQTNSNDPSIGGLYHIQSQAYICLGDVDNAILMVDKSMFNNTNMEWKYELKARYLYQAGREDEALDLLNMLLEQEPSYDAWRYFLRALIYLEMGERDKAEEDLNLGAGNTWHQTGVYQYVMGKMALEDGNTEQGIALLQEAEATLDYLFVPLQKRIQTELRQLGAEPLKVTPSVMFDATAIPASLITPMPRPTIIVYETPSIPVTPTLGIVLPDNIQDTIIVDMDTGSGKLTLLPDDYLLFRFQPIEFIFVTEAKSLDVHLIPPASADKDPDIQAYLWIPKGGGWQTIELEWGDNPIEQPDDYVLPDGSIFMAIQNNGTEAVELNNAAVTLIVETIEGDIKTYGLNPSK